MSKSNVSRAFRKREFHKIKELLAKNCETIDEDVLHEQQRVSSIIENEEQESHEIIVYNLAKVKKFNNLIYKLATISNIISVIVFSIWQFTCFLLLNQFIEQFK